MKQKWFIVELSNIWYTQAPAKFQYMDRFVLSNIEYINVIKYFPRLRFINIEHRYLDASENHMRYTNQIEFIAAIDRLNNE